MVARALTRRFVETRERVPFEDEVQLGLALGPGVGIILAFADLCL